MRRIKKDSSFKSKNKLKCRASAKKGSKVNEVTLEDLKNVLNEYGMNKENCNKRKDDMIYAIDDAIECKEVDRYDREDLIENIR